MSYIVVIELIIYRKVVKRVVMQSVTVMKRHQSAHGMKTTPPPPAPVPSVRMFSAVAGEETEHPHFHKGPERMGLELHLQKRGF